MNCRLTRTEFNGTVTLDIASTFDALWPLYEMHVPPGLRNGWAVNKHHVMHYVRTTGSYSFSDSHNHIFISLLKG